MTCARTNQYAIHVHKREEMIDMPCPYSSQHFTAISCAAACGDLSLSLSLSLSASICLQHLAYQDSSKLLDERAGEAAKELKSHELAQLREMETTLTAQVCKQTIHINQNDA